MEEEREEGEEEKKEKKRRDGENREERRRSRWEGKGRRRGTSPQVACAVSKPGVGNLRPAKPRQPARDPFGKNLIICNQCRGAAL